MYAHVVTAADAHLQKLDIGIDHYFFNLHLGTFSLFLTGIVRFFFISNVSSHYFKYQLVALPVQGHYY